MGMTEYLERIAAAKGLSGLEGQNLTGYIRAFAQAEGVEVDALPDNCLYTYLQAILQVRGVQSVPDNLLTTYLEALAGTYGATDLPDRLISTYLKAIIEALEHK